MPNPARWTRFTASEGTGSFEPSQAVVLSFGKHQRSYTTASKVKQLADGHELALDRSSFYESGAVGSGAASACADPGEC